MNADEFYQHVAILAEASRLNPVFAREVLEASTDERIDVLVEEGKKIIEAEADQAWM
jgi:hypothetical protein